MDKQLSYIILGGLLFFVLRYPHATTTPQILKIGIVALAILFVWTSISAIYTFPKLNNLSKSIYFLMIGITLVMYVSRYLNDYSIWNIVIVRNLMSELMLINLFTVCFVKNFWRKLKIVDYVLTLYVIINFFSLLLFPSGIIQDDYGYSVWFLGGKNMIIRTLIPAIIVNGMCTYHIVGHMTLKSLLLFLICLLSIFLSGFSSTSFIVTLIMGLGLFYSVINTSIKVVNPFTVLLTFIFLNVLIIFFNFQDSFSNYIERYFDKDSSLSGRVAIWEYVIYKILNSPFIGYGYHTVEEWRDILVYSIVDTAAHPHNYFLYIVLQGGLLVFVLFVLLFYMLSKCGKYYSNKNFYFFLTLMYIAFFIEGTTESITSAPLMFPMLGLFVSCAESQRNIKKNQCNYSAISHVTLSSFRTNRV